MTSYQRVFLGIDLGGTKVAVHRILEDGSLLPHTQWVQREAKVVDGPRATMCQIQDAIKEVFSLDGSSWSDVGGVGIGSPGPADILKGVLHKSGHLTHPEWEGFPIREAVGADLSTQAGRPIPLVYDNDGNQACRWEASQLDPERQLAIGFVGPGTGIAGGLWQSGKVWQGSRGQATELGHLYLPYLPFKPGMPEPVCPCRKIGHAEGYASLGALPSILRWILRRGEYWNHPLLEMGEEHPWKTRAFAVRGLAGSGDTLCREIYLWQAKCLGHLSVNLMNFMDLDHIILGSGFFECAPALLQGVLKVIKQTFAANALGNQVRDVEKIFVLARDGDPAGALGAALQARDACSGG